MGTRDPPRLTFLLFRASACMPITVAMWWWKLTRREPDMFWPDQMEGKTGVPRGMKNWGEIPERRVENRRLQLCALTLPNHWEALTGACGGADSKYHSWIQHGLDEGVRCWWPRGCFHIPSKWVAYLLQEKHPYFLDEWSRSQDLQNRACINVTCSQGKDHQWCQLQFQMLQISDAMLRRLLQLCSMR